MLGGIIQSILSGITSVIMAIVQPILELILGFVNRYIIGPIISLIFNLISYALSCFFYGISCFILALIDYVEMMFRLLAGLDVNGVSLNLSNSPDKGADLVVQLIRTPEVRDIFLSMVVVGMFLLIITTIFQMIKVEYTTEGAKNAKGPILMKAFKGLANMILLPALCVFGVVLGNQVLDLLDKATKPDSDLFGKSATISGTLFVAAAAEAHYQKSDFRVVFISPEPSTMPAEVIMNIVPILINSIFDAWGEAFNADDQKNYLFPDAVRKESESLVASGTISYWNIAGISQIYDYSKINYLLLIFGGCIVIKTLYYTCFGMIVRLYQCGMLFIISPAVIGMTPVNESGLGKWRSEFVGQAISAYGVVLALNIFFVLVRVLLSIDFSFEGVAGYFFGASLMEGLLKAIIVMGGTLSIEKFSKEIGGYFGAKDALSQGKEMEKAVGDVAKKAISTAISVAMMATGVGGAAMGGLKAAGGAMKAAGAASKAAGGGLKGFAAGAKSLGGSINQGVVNPILDKVDSGIGYMANSAGIEYETRSSRRIRHAAEDATKADAAAQDDLGKKQGALSRAQSTAAGAQNRVDVLTSEIESLEAGRVGLNKAGKRKQDARIAQKRAELSRATAARDAADQGVAAAQADVDTAAATAEKTSAAAAKASKSYTEDKVARESSLMLRTEAGRQAAKSFFEEKTFLGGVVASGRKQITGYEDAAKKSGGKEIAAAYDHLAKVREDRLEEEANARNAGAIARKNQVLGAEVDKILVNSMQVRDGQMRLQSGKELESLNRQWTGIQDMYRKADEYDAAGQHDMARRTRERADNAQDSYDDAVTAFQNKYEISNRNEITVMVENEDGVHGALDPQYYQLNQNIMDELRKLMKETGLSAKPEQIQEIMDRYAGQISDSMANEIREMIKKVSDKLQK